MATYIFTWNPSKFKWASFNDDRARLRRFGKLKFNWSSGNNNTIVKGERIFLLRQYSERGLIASGRTISDAFVALHWDGSQRTQNKVKLQFDEILAVSDVLPTETLERLIPEVRWMRIQASGIQVKPPAAGRLEKLWQNHLDSLGKSIPPLPEEVDGSSQFVEGATYEITINAYERNAAARRACLGHYGFDCSVCKFSFQQTYGDLGEQYIHVHHLRDLATIGERYEVDPIEDLRPVCPNCHAMLHTERPAMSIERLRKFIKRASA